MDGDMKGNQSNPPKEDTTFEYIWDGSGQFDLVFDPRFFYAAEQPWGSAAQVWAVAFSERGEAWNVAATVGEREELFFRTNRPIPSSQIARWLYIRGHDVNPSRWRRWFLNPLDYSPPVPGATNDDVPHPGAVYFLRDCDRQRIKIGYSADVECRVRNIRGMNCGRLDLIGQIRSPRWYEGLLHRIFSADRIHGEWFRESADLLSLALESQAGDN
jgi:T5orf172 domain